MKKNQSEAARRSVPTPANAGKSPRQPLGKKIVFAAIALLAGMAILEGVLALVGVQPQLYEKDPYVGFSSPTPLFVEERDAEGRIFLATANNRLSFFNRQRFPKAKAPGVTRIFSMGGSTTYGHPYTDPTSFNGWLREFLGATAADRPWEVINAGGISYGSYRVARLMEELIHYQPDLFVVYDGHNEFLERRIYGQIPTMPRGLRGLTGLAWRLRSAALGRQVLAPLLSRRSPEGAGKTVLESEPVTLLDNALGPTAYTFDEVQREQILRHFQFNVQRMVEIARSVGARVIFITPASNLREVSPFKSEHRQNLGPEERARWKADYDRAREDYASPVPTNALAALAAAEAIDDLPASLHFVRARVLEKLGRFAEAKTAYERARDQDVCPLRAPGAIPRILARTAAERRVPLIDHQALVEARSEHGIPGASMFLDHVHPTVEGYRLLALEILKTMEKEGIVRPHWDPALIQRTTDSVLARIDTRAHSLALMNLCKTLGWAGKREEAYRAGARAAEMGGGIPEVRYEAGLAAEFSGRTNEAIAHLRQAVALKPTLGEAHCALGVLFEDGGRMAEAVAEYRLALRYGSPRNAQRDRDNLSRAQQKLPAAGEGR